MLKRTKALWLSAGGGKTKLNNAGFTFVEVIATVAVIVILLAVSGVAVAQHRSYLQIMELDDAAREIYMAAENRAVLLSSARRLDDLVNRPADYQVGLDGAAGSVVGYYVSEADSALLAELLPANSIDPYLRDGYFYIVYEPVSGCVTDVFYAQKAFAADFKTSYAAWRNMDSKERMKLQPMIGYFGGGLAEGADFGAIATASVQVIIENAEELTLQVLYNLPAGMSLKPNDLTVTLSQEIDESHSVEFKLSTGDAVNISGGYMWVLDSLSPYGPSGQIPHFKDWGGALNPLAPGGDFTVKAVLDSGEEKRFLPASAQDTNNSLFAEGSGGDLARIQYLRHLQNLDSGFSGVAGKEQAALVADINLQEHETYPDYEFIPIKNAELKLFAGSEREQAGENDIFKIYGLKVTAASAAGKTGAGLFGEAKNIKFRDVRLINARVQAAQQTVGALVGVADNCVFDGCQVFWQRVQGGETLKTLLGSDDGGTANYNYQIAGKVAGGLAGQKNGGAIKNRLAATLVQGTESAGGLVGGGGMSIADSYADCYLNGANRVGGLIGDAGMVDIQNCYIAGFIDMNGVQTAAALAAGANGKIETHNVYSALCRLDTSAGGGTYYELTESQARLYNDDFVNTFFLGVGEVGTDNGHKGVGKSYMEMIGSDFISTMGSGFAAKGSGESHPYNLREHLQLTAYSFPGLAGLPHYGDWQAEFKEPSLVYYEKYSDGTYGFSGGNARYLKIAVNMADDKTIVEDGYAVAFLQNDLQGAQVKISCYSAAGGNLLNGALTVNKGGLKAVSGNPQLDADGKPLLDGDGKPVKQEYYLALLPGALVNTDSASEEFFSYIKVDLDLGGGTPIIGDYFYNPHFAETVIPYKAEDEKNPISWTAESARAYAAQLLKDMEDGAQIRTPRHLYNLSRFAQYYNRHYVFEQQMDLDYASYTGYELFKDKNNGYYLQRPIGDRQQPFNGRYLGGGHKIAGVGFKQEAADYLGLFGCSEGVLQDIVYWLNDEKSTGENSRKLNIGAYSGAQNIYAGGLAGLNAGEVQNCAVAGLWLDSDVIGGRLYAGGLIGRNDGLVRSCTADVASLSMDGSSYADAWLGGLVGYNSSNISGCYAVGRLSATVDKNSAAKICGFAGYNHGGIKDCYTATDLRSSGLGTETFGFCGQGGLDNCYFLNKGNFTYREISYIADYVREGVASMATPVNYEELTNEKLLPGMNLQGGGYPYPRIINGGSVHYGAWPTPLELGEMGVYYWEKLKIGEDENYYISLLAVNPNAKDENGNTVKRISKSSTLSDAYNDGGVVIDYGYGYYNAAGTNVSLTSTDIYYTTNNGGDTPQNFNNNGYSKDNAVDQALENLMPGFAFHSWHSFQPDVSNGLYPYRYSGRNPVAVRNGSFKLNQTSVIDASKNISVDFWLDPHFADALAVKTAPAGNWQIDGSLKTEPGSAENPYTVRTVAQLEFINWNIDNRNTRTVMEMATNNRKFPYLNYPGKTEKYYWQQTHDLDGSEQTYTPIAEYYDTSAESSDGRLYGWFGGEYDGQDYVIANMNIKGGVSSCAGLFGAVYNGKLKNIILYSADGQGEIRASGRVMQGNKVQNKSIWYCIGGLAGLVASNADSAVDNCAVAGYTIYADVYTAGGGWGGSGIGGLAGISNMALANCSAVTDIVIPATAQDNDNMRIGGLVGTCQQSISNCYAGGSISLDSRATMSNVNSNGRIYIGGIVGGSYMKPLQVGDGANKLGVIGFYEDSPNQNHNYIDRKNGIGMTDNAIYNCYSFVQLPNRNDHRWIGALFAVGGVGELEDRVKKNHGVCTRENNYYLDSIEPYVEPILDKDGKREPQSTDVGKTGVTAVTYRQLQGLDVLNNSNIYNRLTAFAPVTSTKDGHAIAGKYSFPPGSRTELRGRDYPFPTILTRGGADIHVHYGEWPNYGIVRPKGGEPINLDVFAESQAEEQLKLSFMENPPPNGWQVKSLDEKVATAEIAGGRLMVQAVSQGSASLEVSCVYNGVKYTLPVTVNVTAELHLSPQTLTLFGNDTMTAPLLLLNKNNEPVAASDAAGELFKLTSVDCSSQYFSVQTAAPGPDGTTRSLQVGSSSAALTAGEEVSGIVNVGYNYRGAAYSGSNALTLTWQPAPQLIKHQTDPGVYQLTFAEDSTVEAARFANSGDGNKAELSFENNMVTLKGVQEGTANLPLVITLNLAGQTHIIRIDGVIPGAEEGQMFALQRDVYSVKPDAVDGQEK